VTLKAHVKGVASLDAGGSKSKEHVELVGGQEK